jgi:tetratricopeptide (TPR) repeat protein
MAQKSNNDAALREAINAVLASGGATAEDSLKLRRAQGSLAVRVKDYPTAIAAFQEVLKANPNDAAVQNDLMVIYRDQKQYPQAIAMLEQTMASAKAAGQKPTENTYKLALQTALDGKVQSKILPLTREFLAAYPSPQNWGIALDLYRSGSTADDATLLDTFRLMRTAKTLDQANEYLALADTLALGKFYAEARDVINEGVASGKLKASHPGAVQVLKEVSGKITEDRTALASLEGRARSEARGTMALRLAEGYYGHAMYPKAAEFYRLALQKGGVDANLVNTRLGMSHALAGQRAEADAAFKAVTGPRADLAGFWMLWLASRA